VELQVDGVGVIDEDIGAAVLLAQPQILLVIPDQFSGIQAAIVQAALNVAGMGADIRKIVFDIAP